MATVLFVHGTGVRQGSYLSTFALLKRAFDNHRIPHDLEPCLWGDDLGAKQPRLSLPDIIDRSSDPRGLTPDEAYARWDLYRDPLFELRLLKHRPATRGPRSPTASQPGVELWRRIAASPAPRDRVAGLLERAGLETCWEEAWRTIVVDDPTAKTVVESSSEVGEPGQAIARAVVAQLTAVAYGQERPLLDGRNRDALVALLIEEWQARVAGIGTFLMRFFGEMAASIATPLIKHGREGLTQLGAPGSGDVLLYQARGEVIRRYIRRRIDEIGGEVILLAHSLGGIACVDLLAGEPVPAVKALVTAGSQAPFLHELGALSSLEPGSGLPDYFPKWLNFYDPYDFLSYVAGRVFTPGVTDCCIRSLQPFPQSHSAYWTNDDTWTRLREFLA